MAQVMLALHDVTKVYGKGEGRVTALRRVSLRFEQGEFTAVVGPSGSGKTTLLNIIGCLDSPTEGELVWKGVHMKSMDKAELAAYRRTHVSFVFQSFNLIPVLTVTENVELPLLPQASSGNWAHPGHAVYPPIETFYNIQHYSSHHRGGHRV